MEDVFSQGNIAASDELMTPDIIEHEAGPAQERGFEGVKALITKIRTAFPDL